MENRSRGPTYWDFVHYLHRGVDAAHHGCKTTEYKSTSSIKCFVPVLRESLSEDSQYIPWRNTKEKGVVGNLYMV
jgi:hypothetical protein